MWSPCSESKQSFDFKRGAGVCKDILAHRIVGIIVRRSQSTRRQFTLFGLHFRKLFLRVGVVMSGER